MLKPAQLQNFSLYSSGVSIGDTTMTLSSFLTIDGSELALLDFGSIGYMTLEPGSRDREEQISFSGVTQNTNGTATLTGIKTVLFLSPYTESSGFSKSHPGGVTAVVTNTSGFYNKYPVKENDETITGYWAVPDPVSATDIANKEWVLSVVNGGSVSTNALITIGTAGETVSAGKVLYLKAADGRWWLASSATAATTDFLQLGIAQGSGTAGNAITGGVLIRGIDSHQSGLTNGTIYYLSTAGAISSSAGTVERAVGQANSATTLYFDPNFYYIPTAKQKITLTGLTSPGLIVKNSTTSVPTGFLSADGSAVSRTGATAALFAAIGTTYGSGNGTTTFNLPLSQSSFSPGGTFDFASTSSSASATTMTQAHTISGSNSLLVVAIDASGANIVLPQFNGVNMVLIEAISGTSVRWYYQLAPASGTHNITSSFSSGQYNAVAVSYNGIYQGTSLIAHTVSSPGSVSSITLTSTESNPPDLILVYADHLGGDGAPTMTNGTARETNTDNGNRAIIIGDLAQASSSVITFGGAATSLGAIAAFSTLVGTTKYDIIKT